MIIPGTFLGSYLNQSWVDQTSKPLCFTQRASSKPLCFTQGALLPVEKRGYTGRGMSNHLMSWTLWFWPLWDNTLKMSNHVKLP